MVILRFVYRAYWFIVALAMTYELSTAVRDLLAARDPVLWTAFGISVSIVGLAYREAFMPPWGWKERKPR